MGRKRKLDIHSYLDDEGPQVVLQSYSRVARISENRRRIVETPPSPRKKWKKKDVVAGWQPSASFDTADVQTLDSAAAEYPEADPDVVKAKRYFKSVCASK